VNRVTRSMEATTPGEAARVARQRIALPSGWWGVVLLVATEAALFGTLLASYFYLRFKVTDWPPGGIPPPKVLAPLVLTGVLLATAVPMFLAVRAAQSGRPRATWALIVLALVVQAVYLGLQIHLMADDLHKFTPQDNAYGSVYYTLLGAHHAHVLVGILLNLWVAGRLLTGLTNYRVIGVRVIAVYWYFVDVLAVLVTATVLSPSL
jgi:heme/copper-type cytochrome/quinol oxidase subunit 3